MSALTNLSGDGLLCGDFYVWNGTNPAYLSTPVMDATSEKISIVGCVWHPTIKTGTINIRKVHFLTGTITFNAASTVRVSLQSVSATAGAPYQPDGVQDQTYDFASGAGLSANTWTATGNLSADRAVDLSAISLGDTNSRWLAVVFEFQTFTAADSIVIRALNSQASNTVLNGLGGRTLLNTGTWAAINSAVGVVALECDDGSFAFIDGCLPISAFSTASVASNGAIRAAGLRFSFPVHVNVDGLGLKMVLPNNADGAIVIYDSDGTTELTSIAIDNDAVISATLPGFYFIRFPPITFAANTVYRAVFVSSTTTAGTVNYADVSQAEMMGGMSGGQSMHWTQRDSSGTWTETTTRRPEFMFRISAVHDGVGGGGGLAMPVSGRICA